MCSKSAYNVFYQQSLRESDFRLLFGPSGRNDDLSLRSESMQNKVDLLESCYIFTGAAMLVINGYFCSKSQVPKIGKPLNVFDKMAFLTAFFREINLQKWPTVKQNSLYIVPFQSKEI